MNRELREKRAEAESSWIGGHEGASQQGRPEISSSWRRSALRVSGDTTSAPMESPRDVQDRFRESGFGRACRVIEDDLRDIAADGDMVAALADESVTIAWTAGGRRMTRYAEKVHFTIGGRWSEEAVGTNALALAQKLDRPEMVFSAEHFLPMVHDWVCYSAPVFDPRTGHFQGVVDVSSLWSKTNPALLTTVRALARCVQYELGRESSVTAPTSSDSAHVQLRTLGACELRVNGVRVRVTPRQMEMLAVLALYESGLSLDEITAHVYGDHVISPATVKAELSHLRSVLGGVVGSRPYRLSGRIDADHVAVLGFLGRGNLVSALELYRGSMLPFSQSPVIETVRYQIDVAIRNAVLASNDADLLFTLGAYCPEDRQVHERTLEALGDGDLRSGLVAGRLWQPQAI